MNENIETLERSTIEYRLSQLRTMLKHETAEGETHYDAKLSHWANDSKPINIDAGALQAIISYYEGLLHEDADGCWQVPVSWEMSGNVSVPKTKSATLQEAAKYVQMHGAEFNLPKDGQYICDSFHVDEVEEDI